MRTLRNLWGSGVFSAICAAVLCMVAAPANGQSEPEGEPATPYRDAFITHVDRQLSVIQGEIGFNRGILNERGNELLDEIAIRLEVEIAKIPVELRKPGIPEPPEVTRLRDYERTLSGEVFDIEDRIINSLQVISEQRDSVETEEKTADQTRSTILELDRSIRTDLELWKAKVDFVRSRLVTEGVAEDARRMYVLEYNAIVGHYETGDYRGALERMDSITGPYGDKPLAAWRDRLPFYRAECNYSLGKWDQAFQGYMEVWQRQNDVLGQAALLNWTELAFAGGEYRRMATMWASQPTLPADVIDANRVRLLVAESFLRLNEPQMTLSVLDLMQAPQQPNPADAEGPGPDEIEEQQRANDRLIVYGRLLRAEAHLSGGGVADAGSSDYSAQADNVPDAALDSMLAGTPGGIAERGASDYNSRTAYLIASGQAGPQTLGAGADSRTAAALKDLEDLLPLVRQLDPEGPLMARTFMSLGHTYFQLNRMDDAARAYGAVSSSSMWFGEAQLGRAWAFIEDGSYLDAKIAVNAAQRSPLSPPAALEAAALNSYVLSLVGEDERSAQQIRDMKSMVDIQERRAARVWLNQQLQKIDESLRLVGVIALERQNEALYQSAVDEQATLLQLRDQIQRVEDYLQAYASGTARSKDSLTTEIASEQRNLRTLDERVTGLRRVAGQTPAGIANMPEVTYQQRREQLERWLRGVQPQANAQASQVYQKWIQYAEFAYAKRIFDENQRRRYEADRLKDVRTRIQRLLSESP